MSPSPLSPAVTFGDLVFTSGQLGRDPQTGVLVGEGFEAQAERTMQNLGLVLTESGSSLGLVLKTTCFLVNIEDLGEFNNVYKKYFGDWEPARSTVAVAELAGGALVEVEAVAAKSQHSA